MEKANAAGSEVAFVMAPHGDAMNGDDNSNQFHWILDSERIKSIASKVW